MKAKLAFVLMLASFGAHAQVAETVDRFTGNKSLKFESEERIVTDGRPYIVLSTIKGEAGATFFLFASSSRGWRYLRCNSVDWLADDTPLDLGNTAHDGKVNDRPGAFVAVSESIMQHATKAQIQQIGNAQHVEMRICNDEYALTRREIDGIKEFAARMTR